MKPKSLSLKIIFGVACLALGLITILPGCAGNGHNDKADSVYQTVEKPAEFPGGMDQFYKYLGSNIFYPKYALDNNITGKVIVTFVVEKNGSLTDVTVLRGIHYGCDEEAVRVIKRSPKWTPAMQKGQPVRQQYTVPISFTLQ